MKKLVMILGLVALLFTSSWSAAPTQVSFQGLLSDTAGNPLGDGAYNVQFNIYSVPSSGTSLWSETKSVNVADGLFSTNLGSVNPLDASIFDSSPRYLGITVGASPEVLPRILLASVPWSLQSSNADTADYAYSAGTSGGNTFVRWGNSTAPAGTELIYSGYAFGTHYTHAGSNELIVIKTGDPADSGNFSIWSLLYPVEMEVTSSPLAAFIPQDSKMKAAVCFSSAPTMTVWGTHTAPAGWSALYSGFAMGPHYQQSGVGGCPVCVDHLNFEPLVLANQNGALLYPVVTQTAGFGIESGLHNKLVKCVVVKKD